VEAFGEVAVEGEPIEIDLDRFEELSVPQLADEDCSIAVFPVGLKIAMCLDAQAFLSKLNAERDRQR
jgi:hypothetical protein